MITKHALGLFAVLALPFLGGCEETADITDAVYRERIVVNGVLDLGDSVDITFSRTLPINEPYSASSAALADVEATIAGIDPTSGSALHPAVRLVHAGGGHYSAPGLVPQAGMEYRLEASWHGRSVRARTVMPRTAKVDSTMFVKSRWAMESPDEYMFVRAVIDPVPGAVYTISSTGNFNPVTGKPILMDRYGAPIARERDTMANGNLELIDDWSAYHNADSVAAIVVAYDEPYYEFQRTYNRGDDRGPFGSGSDVVRWTVEGDGIGLFIGRSTVIVPVR
jgi:hypothetical protein